MKIRQILAEAIKILDQNNITNPNLDSRILLSHALNYTPEQLILKYDSAIGQTQYKLFLQLINRRLNHEPIAYIVGKKEFYGLEFIVNNSVLIPRPETELIIDFLIKEGIQKINKPLNILELGIGSGAISICIAKQNKYISITAVDICPNAIKIAKHNLDIHNVTQQINLIQSNWYSELKPKQQYQYIVSNPPYICADEINNMAIETIKFEPKIALYAQQEGLYSYYSIINKSKEFLKKNGKIIFEIGYKQADKVIKILNDKGFSNIITINDLSQQQRVIIAGL